MSLLALAGFVVAVMAAASTGAMFQPGAWYERLAKPTWTPPDWLFPVAWTALYAAIAYAAWRVSGAPAELAMPALAFWSAQLVLNAVWSPVFFGLHRLGAAMVVLVCLWACVAMTLVLFLAADTLAGLLIAPYLVWVTFAGALNWWIWRNNTDAAAVRA